jgi:hypothetical protein
MKNPASGKERIMCDKPAAPWDQLQRHCATLPPGPVADVPTLERLLAAAWDALPSDDDSMAGYKLLNRMEAVAWNSPILSFKIERHGGTVMGSSRAKIDEWTVNLERLTTKVETVGRRQVRPPRPRFDAKPIAQELAKAILTGQSNDRLQWDNEFKVRVLIGKILPEGSAVKQTLTACRKRLREALTRLLATARWKMLKPNVYEKE